MVSTELQVILLVLSIIGLVWLIRCLKNQSLEVKYTVLWFALGVLFVILALFPNVLLILSQFVHIQVPANMLFLVGFFVLICISFMLTLFISKTAANVRRLNQEIAILQGELNKYHSRNEEK